MYTGVYACEQICTFVYPCMELEELRETDYGSQSSQSEGRQAHSGRMTLRSVSASPFCSQSQSQSPLNRFVQFAGVAVKSGEWCPLCVVSDSLAAKVYGRSTKCFLTSPLICCFLRSTHASAHTPHHPIPVSSSAAALCPTQKIPKVRTLN